MISKIIKITPVIWALLIFFGVLKLVFYYSYFEIKIINFLEFQEIITSFFNDINILLIFFMSMILISFATLNLASKSSKLGVNVYVTILMRYIYYHRYKYMTAFFIAIIIQVLLLYYKIVDFNYVIIYLLVFCMTQFLTYIFLTKDENGEIEISDFSFIIILGLSLSLSIYLFAQKDIQDTIQRNSSTKIELKNDYIECGPDKNCLYIGKTKNYVFLKRTENNEVEIIPIKEIERFIFKKTYK